MRRSWPDLLDRIGKRSRVTFALLNGATVQSIQDDTLVLMVGTAALAKRLSEQRHTEQITEALSETFGVSWRVRCEFADATKPAPAAAPPRRQPAQRRESSTGRGSQRAAASPTRPRDDIPPPPEPAPDDEDALLAEAAADADEDNGRRRDPEELALELLADQLGARKIDEVQ